MLSGKQRRGWVDNIKKDLGHTYLFWCSENIM
jgi:hypothetical protein